jgi:DNA polymerase (family 10)
MLRLPTELPASRSSCHRKRKILPRSKPIRASARIRNLSESLDEMVRDHDDLTRFAGIGEAIASAIRDIVTTGTLGKLEKLRARVTPAVASIKGHPRLDPKRVLRVYKKLDISSVGELRQ